MRILGPDDYTAGRLVTLTKGPFIPVPTIMPSVFMGATTPTHEDKKLHGRVFRIASYSAPYLLLEAVDGRGEEPQMQMQGPFAIFAQKGAPWAPTGVTVDTRMGVEVAEVGDEYAAAYMQHFVPPKQRSAQRQEQRVVVAGPVTRLLAKMNQKDPRDAQDKPQHK